MGAKRKAVAPASPVEKKAKVVEQTPEQIALDKMLAAFAGDVGTMLSPNVINMVNEVSALCLLPPVENREALETKFAEAVGAALETSMTGLAKAHEDAIAAVKSEEEKVESLETALTEANTMKDKADTSLTEANEAETTASDKKIEAETALSGHVEEEKALQPKKATMEQELAGIKEVQEITRGAPDPNKKEVTKVQKALRDVEAPEALILGIGSAIGKQTPLDQHFVNEATKLLYDKSTKLEGELATFNETVVEYEKKTRTMEATVEQLTTEHNARMEETSEAKKHLKECKEAVKEAEKQKKQGEKSLEKTVQAKDRAFLAEEVGKETKTHFTFLFDRSIAVVEPEVPVEEAVVEAEAAEEEVAAVSPVAAMPEAAMEVEPVA